MVTVRIRMLDDSLDAFHPIYQCDATTEALQRVREAQIQYRIDRERQTNKLSRTEVQLRTTNENIK